MASKKRKKITRKPMPNKLRRHFRRKQQQQDHLRVNRPERFYLFDHEALNPLPMEGNS